MKKKDTNWAGKIYEIGKKIGLQITPNTPLPYYYVANFALKRVGKFGENKNPHELS